MSDHSEILNEDLKNTSKAIGETIRSINFGIIGVIFLIFTSKELNTLFQIDERKSDFFKVCIICIIVLLFDYLQAFVGYVDSLKNFNSFNNDEEVRTKSAYKSMRYFFFYTKQLLTIIGTVWFLLLISKSIF